VLTGVREVRSVSRHPRFAVLIAALLVMGIASLAAATTAGAKPAVCDEYPDLPVCADNAGGGPSDEDVGSDDASGTATPVSGSGDGSSGGVGGTGSGGELPFTGYPLTPLLLLLLLLLAIGLAVRAGIAINDRLRRDDEAVVAPPAT
jgi:hypothetical protein